MKFARCDPEYAGYDAAICAQLRAIERGEYVPSPAAPATSPLPDIPLAGDVVEALAKRIGADRLARLWEQWTGKPCNCSQRKEAMNRATEKLLKWARRLGLIRD